MFHYPLGNDAGKTLQKEPAMQTLAIEPFTVCFLYVISLETTELALNLHIQVII